MKQIFTPTPMVVVAVILATIWSAGAQTQAGVKQALEPYTADATNYQLRMERRPLAAVEEIIRHASVSQYKEIENWLLSCFQLPHTTPDFKEFACRMLERVGSADAVPVITPLLRDDRFAHLAVCALLHVPEPAVDEALRAVLPGAQDCVKLDLINAMGERRQARNTEILTGLLGDPDGDIATAAVVALGKIGDSASLESLAKARLAASPAVHEAATRACLDVAERMCAHDQKDAAAKLFDEVYASESSKDLRAAAFRGRIEARAEEGIPLLTEAIQSESADVWAVAMQCAREIPGPTATEQLAALAARLSGIHKAQMLYALADRGDKAALPAVMAALQDADETSKAAAYDAVAALGDAAAAVALAKIAATHGPDAETARESLKLIPGKEASTALIQALETPESTLKIELVRALAARRAADAATPLLSMARDPDAAVRLEAIKALGALARYSALRPLLDLLAGAATVDENEALAEALAAAANRSAGGPERTSILLAALDKARSPRAKANLVEALGSAADDTALDACQNAIRDASPEVQDAAMRTLAAWSSPGALPILHDIATTSPRTSHRILALRGYIRLVEQAQDWPAAKKLAAYREAMDLAVRAEEKKQMLGCAAAIADPEALDFIEPYLANPELANEAAAAVLRIASAIAASHPARAESALAKLEQASKDEALLNSVRELLGKLRAPRT